MIRSIRTKLILLFAALAAVPMIGVGVASYLNSLSSVEAVVEHRAAGAARDAAEELQGRYRSRLGEVELLARNQEVADLYDRYAQVGGAAVDELQPRLDRFFGQFLRGPREVLARVSYLDREGALVFQYARSTGTGFELELARYSLTRADASLDGIDPGAFEASRRSFAFETLPNYGPVLRVARRIEDRGTGEPLGLLLADIQIDQLLRDTRFDQAFSPAEYLALLDRQSGRFLFHPSGTTGQELGDLIPGLTADQLVATDGSSGILSSGSGEAEWVVAFANWDEPAWTVAAISDASLFTGPPRRAGTRNLAVTFGSAALALLLLLWMATRITRSIRQVAVGAEAIAGGDLDQQITVDANDETSVLADAFNRMAASLRGTLGELRQLTAELEDRVRRRTAALEEANTQLERQFRDLEVERALERVRTQVAAMEDTGGLSGLVATVHEEMQQLGTPCARMTVGTIDEAAGTIEFYGMAGNDAAVPLGTGIHTAVDWEEHLRTGETWVRRMTWADLDLAIRQAIELGFISEADAEEARRRDPPEDHWVVDAYYARGSLAMRKPAPEPFSDEDIRLLERFTEVFALGYTRYLDLKGAEERARQAELERAVERVRSAAMAMRSADDMRRVVAVVYQGMLELGIETPAGTIVFVDEEAGTVTQYYATHDPKTMGLQRTEALADANIVAEGDILAFAESPRSLEDFPAEWIEPWRTQVTGTFEGDYDEEDLLASVAEDRAAGARYGMPHEYAVKFMSVLLGHWAVTNVPVRFGQIGYRERQHNPDNARLVAELAAGVELGYLRFMDFQRLEEQNRQADLSRARHRVRSEVMAMTSTDDIDHVVVVLREELGRLGVTTDQVGINVVDEDGATLQTAWTASVGAQSEGPDEGRQEPATQEPSQAVRSLLEHWRRRETWSRRRSEGTDDPQAPGWVVDVPFDFGTLAMNRGQTDPGAGAFTQEEVESLSSFTDVVSLGYTRFRDFQRLEEQNRELAAERAVERMRAEAGAMRESADILNVVAALWQGLSDAGLDFESCIIQVVDEPAEVLRLYCGCRHETLMAANPRGFEEKILARDLVDGVDFGGTDVPLAFARERGWAMPGLEPSIVTTSDTFHLDLQQSWGGTWPESVSGTPGINVPFSHGGLFVTALRQVEYASDDLHLVERFADALSLSYTRYLDLLAAEERAQQQAREAASERVRAAAMSMESRDDIRSVVGVLFEEMQRLGIDTPGATIEFLDPRTDEATVYDTNRNFRQYGLEWTSPDVVEFSDEIMTCVSAGSKEGTARLRSLPSDAGPSSEPSHYSMDLLVEYGRTHYGMQEEAMRSNPLLAEVWAGDWIATTVPFAHGALGFRERELNEDHVAIVRELARALSLGFVRFLDFQRLEEQNKALELANDEIQQANRLKSEFLANMSHELRTPMNAIVGFSKLVYRKAKGVLDNRQVGNLEKVLQSSEILLALINDILDLSKIEAGRLEMQPEEFDIRELVQGCISTVSPMVKGGVTVQADLSDQVRMVYSDPSRIRQILINLLSNAAKFTETGTITVGLKPVGEDLLELSVADSGIGIPKESLEAIFEQFRQVDGTTTRKYGGTGLGLSISQRLAGMLGGGIRVESEEGRGATFTVSIAARYGQAAQTGDRRDGADAEGGLPTDGAPTDGRRIVLCIDDDPNVISLISQELEEEGYQVVGATRALEGIEKAHSVSPCAITLDIMMPGMDGWEAITRLKADPATRDLPLIVISIIDNKELGYRLGADEYLVKPVDKEALLRSLQRFDRGGGEALVIDDDPAVVELVTQLLEEDGWTVQGAGDGQEGLNKLRQRPPDVVLLDLMMPVMDGFEALRKIRASRSERIRNLPVIIVTAKDLSAQERRDLLQSTTRIIEKDGLDRERLLHELRDSLREMNGARGD